MRLTRQKSVLAVPQLNMASMVDVVFLLLIFFMCTSSLNPLENDISSQLSRLGKGRGQGTEPESVVRIHVLAVTGGVQIRCSGKTIRSFSSLEEELKKRVELDDRRVVIEGQAGVAFRYMVAALDACHRAGVRRVAFSPREVSP